MIAKVRIAPVERWCPAAIRDLERHPRAALAVGAEVPIYTESRHYAPHDYQDQEAYFWKVPDEWWQKFGELIGFRFAHYPSAICEHMLEMD